MFTSAPSFHSAVFALWNSKKIPLLLQLDIWQYLIIQREFCQCRSTCAADSTYQNNISKFFVLQKKAIRTINNLAYNEHTNAYFKCNKILKLSDQYKLKISNYIFQVLHSNIDEEMKSSLLINNQIHCHNTKTNNQMSIFCVNRSKLKHCVLHNGMITWNSQPMY